MTTSTACPSYDDLRAKVEWIKAEIDKLAKYILSNHDREIVADGACGTAIQIIDRLKARLAAADEFIDFVRTDWRPSFPESATLRQALAAYDALKEAKP